MISFFKKRLFQPLINFLKQGASPARLALGVSLGITIATVPVFGSATLLCGLVIWLFRLNPTAVLLVNQFAYPLQFVAYLPLIRAGEWLFQAEPMPFSVDEVFELFATDTWAAIQTLWWSTLYALTAWLVLMIPVTWGLSVLFRSVFRNIAGQGLPEAQEQPR